MSASLLCEDGQRIPTHKPWTGKSNRQRRRRVDPTVVSQVAQLARYRIAASQSHLNEVPHMLPPSGRFGSIAKPPHLAVGRYIGESREKDDLCFLNYDLSFDDNGIVRGTVRSQQKTFVVRQRSVVSMVESLAPRWMDSITLKREGIFGEKQTTPCDQILKMALCKWNRNSYPVSPSKVTNRVPDD